jgi:hypothetical protein
MLLLAGCSSDRPFVHCAINQIKQGNDRYGEFCVQKLLDSSSEERSCPALCSEPDAPTVDHEAIYI